MSSGSRAGSVRLALVLLAVPAVLTLHTALTYGLADILTLGARAQLTTWQRDARAKPGAEQIGQARTALQGGLRWLPGNADFHEGIAFLYGVQASRAAAIPELRDALLDEVAVHYRAALRSRPMSPYAWANIALALHLKQTEPDAMWAAFDRAMRYGQREGGVQLRLATIGLARWNEAGEARQKALAAMLAAASGATAKALGKQVAQSGIAGLAVGTR